MTEVSRRTVIKATGAISAAMLPAGAAIGTTNTKEPEVARPIATRSICAAAAASNTYVFFNSEEGGIDLRVATPAIKVFIASRRAPAYDAVAPC
jgi:hypothetical protein